MMHYRVFIISELTFIPYFSCQGNVQNSFYKIIPIAN